MCLITYKQDVKITNRDIIVYKALHHRYSPHMGTHYEVDLEYDSELKFEVDIHSPADNIAGEWLRRYSPLNGDIEQSLICVSEGLHSITNVKRAIDYSKDYYNGGISNKKLTIYEATIPAGSQYVMDETGLIVSNKLIVSGIVVN